MNMRHLLLIITFLTVTVLAGTPLYAQASKGYKVTGEVFYQKNRKALSDVFITVYEVIRNDDGHVTQYSAPNTSYTTTTDKDGKFAFVMDGKKEYLMTFLKEGFLSVPTQIPFKKRNIALGEHISIKVGMKKAANFLVRGRVIDAKSGETISEASVALSHQEDEGNTKLLTTDQNGVYSFMLQPQKQYEISANADGYFKTIQAISVNDKKEEVLSYNFRLNRIESGAVTTLNSFFFEVNGAKIIEGKANELLGIQKMMEENPNVNIEIGCHTDARGDDGYNMQLSIERADAIAEFLIKMGIDSSRLITKGYGETQLVNHCNNGVKCSRQEHETNRRVTIKVIGSME
ncbi:OmpA family protein [Limibacter armeniacum]|uniref:OmpA family protein n=1 Tax=Limibacter armeniacum TaxID=466084 RepID=UPI002FE56CD0